MAEFKTKDRDVQRLSVGVFDFDVKNGVVDLSGLDEDERRVAEFELSSLSLVERADAAVADEAADDAADLLADLQEDDE